MAGTDVLVREALERVASHVPPDFRRAVLSALHDEEVDARSLLGDVLICNPNPLSEPALHAVDQVLTRESRSEGQSTFTGALTCALEGSETKVVVWRGDITTLAVDCIVNAANDGGLGCFQPSHRCIDNVIHRAAGPRLRERCRELMADRPHNQLPAGAAPLITPGYMLPAKWVLHVTGPALRYGSKTPTAHEEALLTSCYTGCLDAAVSAGAHSIAFCCVSTGLYGYPGHLAAKTALNAVRHWLTAHPDSQIATVVFDVFTPQDDELYHAMLPAVFPVTLLPRAIVDPNEAKIALAAQWVSAAEAILVCAGAGMSVKAGEMVYTSPADFARFYPNFRLTSEWGYTTAYECMGIFHDPKVPQAYRWGFWATHAMNQRYRFEPNDGYRALRALIGQRNYFVYTSNADGVFSRADFSTDRIFTPQGDWQWYQCAKPCCGEAYWPSKPMLERCARDLQQDGGLPKASVPKCSFCGGDTLPNVRGGDWFLETPHEPAKQRYKAWLRSIETQRLAIIEVGAGFNTPVVTRFPMEAIARRLEHACLVRINPTEAEVPSNIPRAVGISMGWEAIQKLVDNR